MFQHARASQYDYTYNKNERQGSEKERKQTTENREKMHTNNSRRRVPGQEKPRPEESADVSPQRAGFHTQTPCPHVGRFSTDQEKKSGAGGGVITVPGQMP